LLSLLRHCLTEVTVRRNLLPGLVCVGLALAATLWPADVHAQRRRARVRPPVRAAVVAVRPRHYRPYVRPYVRPYYSSFFGPFHGGLFWQPFPYPYPYYGYRYDDRAEVRIDGTPREAEVFVDGYFAGLVDDFDGFSQRLRIEPGDHEITIYHPGHRTWSERVRLRPRQSMRIPASLDPLAPGVEAEPRPAPTGPPSDRDPNAPRSAPPSAPGEQSALGTLSLGIQPADAEVLIDGEPWDWPDGETRLVVDLPEGSHRLEVRREGHRPYVTSVEVRRGSVTTLNVSLRRD
jgi:hypothetical protein